MKVAVPGREGALRNLVCAELERQGHSLDPAGEAAIYLPGSPEELDRVVREGDFQRIVLRSNAYAYGSNTKNPGLMTEDRVSLLPESAPEQRWLRLEEIAARHPNSASLRLANVLIPGEGDLIVDRLAGRSSGTLLGHDPTIQVLAPADAARALVTAAASDKTGIFNIAGNGVIPLRKALRAAGASTRAMPKPFAQSSPDAAVDQLEYNWTVSGERARAEMDFVPQRSTIEALREFIQSKDGGRPELLLDVYDTFGMDPEYLDAWGWWFAFLRDIYWRIDSEGMEHIPQTGGALYVSNHRGFMPLDAVMHLSLVLTQRQRVVRFLIIHSLLRLPVLCDFLTKVGGVVASQENAQRLYNEGNLIGIFPEGIRGTFQPYKQTYQLRDFAKSALVKMAIEFQAPIIPVPVIGHSEIFPILGRIDSSWVTRELGWPYLPIAPMFPLAPVPLPSKWHVRVLEPIRLTGLTPDDAENVKIVRDVSRYIQSILQTNIDQMRSKRKHIFWGRVLDGTAPATPPLPLQLRAAGGH
ncbi:MAG: 1-acyl-sn-glycerol-3-phosphate acyltransferase [Bryobacteraceae bacterium]